MLDEYAAVKTALAVGPLTGRVYDTVRIDSTGNLVREAYAVLYGGTPDRLTDERYTAAQRPGSRAFYTYTVRAVAPDPGGVRAVTNTAINNLVGKTLTIPSRVCAPITLELGDDVQEDESVTPPMFYSDTEFQLISAPAV